MSRDGGATWEAQCWPVTLAHDTGWWVTAAFGQGPVGIAAGNTEKDRFVLRTADHGQTWEPAAIPLRPAPVLGGFDIELAGERDIWVLDAVVNGGMVGYDAPEPFLYHSGDGGNTFTSQALPAAPSMMAVGISFPDPLHGWALARGESNGLAATLFTTVDGGNGWVPLTVPVPEGGVVWGSYTGLHFLDATTGFVTRVESNDPTRAVWRHVMLRTTDSGLTWTPVLSIEGQTTSEMSISFVDAATGFVSGSRRPEEAEVWATTDGGITWESRGPFRARGLWRLSFADVDHGYGVVGGRPCLLTTSDGGRTWGKVPLAGAPPEVCEP